MASFPNTVKTFTSKNNGDTIQPSHVNDLQDEVNAIEDGFRNGTAPLNSSKSTCATLSVTGGSTLGDLVVLGNPPCIRVQHSTLNQIPNNAVTGLSWDTEILTSTSGMHSTASNSSRLIATSSGIYHAILNINWSAGSTAGDRQASIKYNDATFMAYTWSPANNVLTANHCVSAIIRMNTNDYVTATVFQTSGTTCSIQQTVAGNFGQCDFTLAKMR